MLSRPTRGFTLVELLVTLAVVAILATIATPSLRTVIENNRVRAVSEAWHSGLDLGRAEAVRLNTLVQFTLSDKGWTVTRADNDTVLHRGSGKESAQGIEVTYTPWDADTVTFDAFGRTVSPTPDGSSALTDIRLASANTANLRNPKPRRIQILSSGLTRLCDPSVASTAPTACL